MNSIFPISLMQRTHTLKDTWVLRGVDQRSLRGGGLSGLDGAAGLLLARRGVGEEFLLLGRHFIDGRGGVGRVFVTHHPVHQEHDK